MSGEYVKDGVVAAIDGAKIRYRALGRGRDWIVYCNGLGVSTFFWDHITRYLFDYFKFLLWDYRGHGISDPPVDMSTFDIPGLVEDLFRVMDDNKIRKAILIGHSMGAQVIFEAYRKDPDRVTMLVPILGSYGRPIDTFFDSALSPYLFKIIYPVARRYANRFRPIISSILKSPIAYPGAKLIGLIHRDLCSKEDLFPYLDHLSNLDFTLFFELARKMQEHTTEDILQDIRCPVLIVAGENDLFTPMHLSLRMHEMIPNSELLVLKQGSHAGLIEQPELIALRIHKAYCEKVLKQRRPRVKGRTNSKRG